MARELRLGHTSGHADEALIRALHDEYAGALFGFALRLTGSRERAEDVAQETLLRAWQHPEALATGPAAARGWLFTVARNLVTDGWRRDAARPRTTPLDSVAEPPAADAMDRAVESWTVAEAVSRLTAQHRQVLALVVQAGYSVAEAAAVLGIPEGTVKSRTYYALRALRLSLEEMGFRP